MPALPAYLVIHAIAFGGFAQGVDAFYFPDQLKCEQAQPRYVAMRAQTAHVTMSFCTTKQPDFWFGNVPKVLSLLCNPVVLESRVMSDAVKPFKNFLDALIADQMRRGLTHGNVLNINAMDELDPVHDRATRNAHVEQDYDGDLGREHADHMRDNGAGGRCATVAGTFIQIADALPVIEAPSIVTEIPEQAEQTVAYLAKRESEG